MSEPHEVTRTRIEARRRTRGHGRRTPDGLLRHDRDAGLLPARAGAGLLRLLHDRGAGLFACVRLGRRPTPYASRARAYSPASAGAGLLRHDRGVLSAPTPRTFDFAPGRAAIGRRKRRSDGSPCFERGRAFEFLGAMTWSTARRMAVQVSARLEPRAPPAWGGKPLGKPRRGRPRGAARRGARQFPRGPKKRERRRC